VQRWEFPKLSKSQAYLLRSQAIFLNEAFFPG